MERKKVENRIRELREMHNYTREGMAEMVEISPKFLYEIESGKKGFSSDVLCKIARTLTVSCDYIMYGEEHSLRNGEKIYYILKISILILYDYLYRFRRKSLTLRKQH